MGTSATRHLDVHWGHKGPCSFDLEARDMDRREALRYFAATALLPMLRELQPYPSGLGHALYELTDKIAPGEPLRVLDQKQNMTVIAATECIIPATDTPGASAAGVNHFIDAMLADWYPPADREHFLAGLAELDDRTRKMYGKPFAECRPEEQIMVFTAFNEEAAATQRPGSPTAAMDPP